MKGWKRYALTINNEARREQQNGGILHIERRVVHSFIDELHMNTLLVCAQHFELEDPSEWVGYMVLE